VGVLPNPPPAAESLDLIARHLAAIETATTKMANSMAAIARWDPSNLPVGLGPLLARVDQVTEALTDAVAAWNRAHP
jgi:hypothetical protein